MQSLTALGEFNFALDIGIAVLQDFFLLLACPSKIPLALGECDEFESKDAYYERSHCVRHGVLRSNATRGSAVLRVAILCDDLLPGMRAVALCLSLSHVPSTRAKFKTCLSTAPCSLARRVLTYRQIYFSGAHPCEGMLGPLSSRLDIGGVQPSLTMFTESRP
jgi:hypothetical protein